MSSKKIVAVAARTQPEVELRHDALLVAWWASDGDALLARELLQQSDLVGVAGEGVLHLAAPELDALEGQDLGGWSVV